jgi:hypothetical protein
MGARRRPGLSPGAVGVGIAALPTALFSQTRRVKRVAGHARGLGAAYKSMRSKRGRIAVLGVHSAACRPRRSTPGAE